MKNESEKVKKLFYYMMHDLKLTRSKAFKVIFHMDEELGLLDENYELCSNCKSLYSSHSEGTHCEECSKFFCGNCLYICPHDE